MHIQVRRYPTTAWPWDMSLHLYSHRDASNSVNSPSSWTYCVLLLQLKHIRDCGLHIHNHRTIIHFTWFARCCYYCTRRISGYSRSYSTTFPDILSPSRRHYFSPHRDTANYVVTRLGIRQIPIWMSAYCKYHSSSWNSSGYLCHTTTRVRDWENIRPPESLTHSRSRFTEYESLVHSSLFSVPPSVSLTHYYILYPVRSYTLQYILYTFTLFHFSLILNHYDTLISILVDLISNNLSATNPPCT